MSATMQASIARGCFISFGNFPRKRVFDADGCEDIGHLPFQLASYLMANRLPAMKLRLAGTSLGTGRQLKA
jgi:hypothetical protein